MEENERKAWLRGPPGARPIGAFAARMLDPVARARGFATTALLSEWRNDRGADLASFTLPDKVVWPRRSPMTARRRLRKAPVARTAPSWS